MLVLFFLFNDTPTTDIYTLSLHDALPISSTRSASRRSSRRARAPSASSTMQASRATWMPSWPSRSEEHTSELQSRVDLVCRLLLEKKKRIHSKPKHYQGKYNYYMSPPT